MAEAGNIVARLQLKVDQFRQGIQDARQELTNFSNTTRTVAATAGTALAAIGAAAGTAFAALGIGAVKAAADAETQLAKMETAMQGNTEAAKEYIAWAKEFAKTTPFESGEVVDATIKLKAYGLEAKDMLTSIGNMASGMGKGLDQAVEAVADAQTGELERLKEFGITKQMLIDEALRLGKGEIVNAQGSITNLEALNEALLSIMDKRFKDGMLRQSKTFNGQVSMLKDNWKNFLTTIGNAILPTLKDALTKINAWAETIDFQAVGERAGAVFGAIVNAIVGVGNALVETYKFYKEHETVLNALAAVIAGVVIPAMVGFIVNATVLKAQALWGLIVSTSKMIAANYMLGLSYLTAYAPIILIVAGIIALIAVIYLLIKNWDTVKAVTLQVWEAIKTGLSTAWEWIKLQFQNFMTWISNVWSTAWNAIKSFGETIWNGIKTAAFVIWEALKLYFTTVLNTYKTIFTTVWNAISTVLSVVWNTIKTVASTIFEALKTYFTTVLNFYKTTFTTVWNGIVSVLSAIWNGLKATAMAVFNGLKGSLSSIFNAIKSVITSVWNAIRTVTTNVWSGISSVISSMVGGIRSKISDAANFMRNTFSGAIQAVKGFFGGLWSSISQSLQNVVSGIKSKVMQAKEWLTELNPFKRHSPSLVDNVLAGTKIIRQTYESLGGMQIAPPQIGSLTAGRINVEDAFGGGNGSGGNGGTNYNAPLVQVENMHVRSDQDVRGVSKELFNLQRNHDRAKGGR